MAKSFHHTLPQINSLYHIFMPPVAFSLLLQTLHVKIDSFDHPHTPVQEASVHTQEWHLKIQLMLWSKVNIANEL